MDETIGLRIDVDTYRGTKVGVPALCSLLRKYETKATFYFSVGPDNMGRHLWRLLKPAFLWKMLRTNAASLYGPEIILMGTLWRGPLIGEKLANIIKAAADDGHEIGLHAWDHHRIQAAADKLAPEEIHENLRKGVETLTRITGAPPISSAVPGWRCNEKILAEKSKFDFTFNSDVRGTDIFVPILETTASDGDALTPQPQIPTTMPTYDELLGKNGVTSDNYNDSIIEKLRPGQLNVLTIHAEVEGGKCLEMFDDFLRTVMERGWNIVPLGELLDKRRETLPSCNIARSAIPGREGWVATQQATETPSTPHG